MTILFAQSAWLVPLYPLVASLLSLCWSPGLISRTGPRPCGYLNLLMVSAAFLHSCLALVALHSNSNAGSAAIYCQKRRLRRGPGKEPALPIRRKPNRFCRDFARRSYTPGLPSLGKTTIWGAQPGRWMAPGPRHGNHPSSAPFPGRRAGEFLQCRFP